MSDRYTYPGSDVLVNAFGITDYDDWKDAEADFIGARMGALHEHPIAGRYDLAHLQAIHRQLTQDMYSWGGEIRTTDTHPGGTGIAHCRPQFIVPETERVFGALAERDYLRGLDADAFSDGLAWVWGETTAIHPFRDVNTRSQHVFFNQFARDAGWVIDWSQIPGDVFGHARTLAIVEDHSGIDALIRPNLHPFASTGQQRPALTVEQVRSFQARGISRTPEALDRELNAARERRDLIQSPHALGHGDEPDNGGSSPGLGR
ncbi:Fic/DOC family protein [Kocuria sp.]|uniref:Fic/DOC family protein n=1 Tax=Kocuria sp. TaxID=1871328 RepID=UPI0026E090D2|nr:Fic family protein [Kocuria sp.]MDO5619689.1 Fic family protein [Kocuria sp.]